MENRVGFGLRLGAFAIDIVFVWILAIILASLVPSFYAEYAKEQVMNTLVPGLMFRYNGDMLSIIIDSSRISIMAEFVGLVYFLPEIIWGVSLGKLMLKLRIVNANGNDASKGVLAGRYVVKHIGTVFSVLVLVGVSLLTSLGNLLEIVAFIGCFFAIGDNKQALHDIICRTAVIKVAEPEQAQSNEKSNWI